MSRNSQSFIWSQRKGQTAAITNTYVLLTLLALIFTEISAYDKLNVEPHKALLNVGSSADLLCSYPRALTYCRISVPGEPKILNLSPVWNKSHGFTYYGAGLSKGDCGVTIERAKAENNGKVKCYLGVEGEEFEGYIDVLIAMRPEPPIIEYITKADSNGYFMEGSQFRARCIVRGGRPPANISWLIDEHPANKQVTPLEYKRTTPVDHADIELTTTVQEISWYLSAEDANTKLVCRSHHQTDRDNMPLQKTDLILNVHYQPIRQPQINVYGLYLEHTAVVNITIQANPVPRIEWTVDGITIPQGTTDGRYAANEPQYISNDMYNLTLTIAGLTLEDTNKMYYVRASNALGSTDYQVHISSSSTPPASGLDIAAIVGIAIAVAVLVLIALLIVFARSTGRWCFGGATLNTDISPDSEAQINPDLNEDLEGRDNGDEHIDTTHRSEEATPPVTDKLEAQKKAELKNNAATNGHQNGTEPIKSNTSV